MTAFYREVSVAYVFILACVLNVPVLLQTDIVLSCDSEWEKDTVVTLTCTMLGTSYPSKCTAGTPSGRLSFRRHKGNSPDVTCAVPDLTCTSSSSPPSGCACVSKAPNYIVEYKFIANETYSGTWDCAIDCYTGSGFTPALSIRNASCGNIITAKAVVSSCHVQVTSDWPWKVTGSCDVSKVFSSVNNYTCTVFQGTSETSQTIQVASVNYSVTPSEPGYYRGSCSFTANLPVTPASYYYRIIVYPGATETLTSPIAVVRASSPTITACTPENYLPENTSLTCRCTTDVGQPAGRLVWRRIQPSDTVINTGNYGDTVLDMTPQTLTRSDHDVTKFRCDVQWAEDVEGDTYTARVGYGPEDTALSLNSTPANFTVQENATVIFHCQGKGRPKPGIILMNQNSGVEVNESQSSPLTHTMSRARCEDAAVYTCIASNDVGPNQRDTRTLYVKCKPRSGTPQLPTLNLDHQMVTHIFQVTAYPVPDQFNFTFLGSNMTSGTPGEEVKDVELNVTCTPTPGVLYNSTCTLTVSNVNSPPAVGFYRIWVANTEGHQDFTFHLTAHELDPQDRLNAAAVGGGVAAAFVFIIVAIVVVVLFLKWRRKETHQSKPTRQNGGYLEMDSNGLGAESAGQQSGDSSAPPAQHEEYAMVKKKKTRPAASGQEAEAYAVVDKTNKNSPGKKAKPATKPAKAKKPNKGKDETGLEYMNVGLPLSMTPPYSKLSEEQARQVTSEDLVYTSVDFSGASPQKTKSPAPSSQGVVYSAITFNKQAQPQ